MPKLTVTGGPTAPAGKVLAPGSRLSVRFNEPYVDGAFVHAVKHEAELDGASGGWKPLGAADGVPFQLPGGASGEVKPPPCVLQEHQVYTDATKEYFQRGPFEIYETAAGVWFYPSPPPASIFVSNPDVAPANAILQTEKAVAGGVATLNGSLQLVQGLPPGSVTTAEILDGAVVPSKLDTAYLPLTGGTLSGDLTLTGILNHSLTGEISRALGVTGDFIVAIEDGDGAVVGLWNATPGVSPTFIKTGQNASRIRWNPATSEVAVAFADGAGAAAGDPIIWSDNQFRHDGVNIGRFDLKTGVGTITASANSTQYSAMQSYAFASPIFSNSGGSLGRVLEFRGLSSQRLWSINSSGGTGAASAQYQYVTASGQPRIWAAVDTSGNIIGFWEAEDPADDEFPDECPIVDIIDNASGESLMPGLKCLRIALPDEKFLTRLMALPEVPLPDWAVASIYKGAESTSQLTDHICRREFSNRALPHIPDIRAVYGDSSLSRDKRDWQIQLWLQAFSRAKYGYRASTLTNLLIDMCVVDSRGELALK